MFSTGSLVISPSDIRQMLKVNRQSSHFTNRQQNPHYLWSRDVCYPEQGKAVFLRVALTFRILPLAWSVFLPFILRPAT